MYDTSIITGGPASIAELVLDFCKLNPEYEIKAAISSTAYVYEGSASPMVRVFLQREITNALAPAVPTEGAQSAYARQQALENRIVEVPTAEALEAAGQTTLYCNCAKPSRAIGKTNCVVCERPIK